VVTSSFIKKAAWAIVPAVLLLSCQWLANTMTGKEVSLNYKVSTSSVNDLYSVYIEFSNYSEIAIDKVQIGLNPPNLIDFAYDPATLGGSANAWEGEIISGKSLKVLYVLNKEMPISASYLNSLLNAEYRKRNQETGRLEWVKVKLNEGEVYLSGVVAYLIWFFAPIIISLIVGCSILYLRSRARS